MSPHIPIVGADKRLVNESLQAQPSLSDVTTNTELLDTTVPLLVP